MFNDEIFNLNLDEEEIIIPTEEERNDLLNKLSDDILISNIEEQLNAILVNNTDNNILDIFNKRYDFIIKFYPNDEKIIESCKEVRRNLYTKIFEFICNRYCIETNLGDDKYSDDFIFFTKELYNFFILNRKNNIIEFFTSYIYTNKNQIAKEYKSDEEKKDLVFKSLKKALSNTEDILIIYHIEDIINNFINTVNDANKIILAIINLDEFEASNYCIKDLLIFNKFDTYIMNDKDFIQNFFQPIKDYDIGEDLITYIRNNLLNIIKK